MRSPVEVSDDGERHGRKRHRERVSLGDLEAAAKSCRQVRIELDRDHATRLPRERPGQPAVSGADLDDQLVRADVEPADDVLGETPTAKEVLREPATRTARMTYAVCHGTSP